MRKNHLLRKRIFSIIMTLIMVVSLIPANVWADEIANTDNAANSTTHSHCVCGKTTHQDIGDHNRKDETTFTAWDPSEHLDSNGKPTLPTEAGAYYLTNDVTLTDSWQLTGGGVTLCLNGHTVNVSSGATIKINGGGKLILTDCSSTNTGTIKGSDNAGAGIEVSCVQNTTASFMMYGGTITDFKNAVIAGNISSWGTANFTMYGGTIKGNNTGSAAAVSGRTAESTTTSGIASNITMYGGEISNNIGEAGGGVYVGQNCTFNMKGGKISSNEATGRDVKDPNYGEDAIAVHNGGGGVYLDHLGSFEMTGGEISGNTANGNGGGICVMTYAASPNVTITGGTITENTANNGYGGGIYGGPAKLTIQNTEISNNKCAGNGGGIFTTQPLTLESVQITGNTASTNGGYEGGGIKIGGTSDNYGGKSALTVSGNTSISDNSPNNYYVNQSYLLPIKVSGALGANARIGICLNKDTATDVSNDKFLPTTTSDSVVATAESGVTLDFKNFTADYRYYVVRDNSSDTSKVEFGLCDHDVSEGSDTCSKCNTKFVAVLEPKDEGANKEYFRDLNDVEIDNKTGTLKLFHDVTFSKAISIYRSTLTLDLNGHTIEKAKGVLSPIKLGNPNSKDYRSVLTVIDSKKETKDSKLDVEFTVTAGSTLNLYDGTNAQSYQGTVGSVKLTRTGKLVSCGGRIEELWLYRTDTPSDRWEGLKLWQDNDQCCIIGTIRYSESEALYVNDVLAQTNPGCTLYGTKDGKKTAVTGNYVRITSEGVDGGYTDLYLQAHEHTPKSKDELTCTICNAALVVEISATKNGETYTAYFTKDSNDTTRWNNGQDEAAARLADWVKAGYTDAKLIPHGDLQGTMNLTCKMTLEGTGYDIGYVNVKDGAEVTFAGGTYTDGISVRGKATFNGGTYYSITVADDGQAVLASGTYHAVTVNGGTATVKAGTIFNEKTTTTSSVTRKIEVAGGTLNVEGGTFNNTVTVKLKGSLTVSGGEFTNEVTINSNTSGTCVISGGTFDGTVNVWLNTSSVGTCTISGGTFAKLEAGSNSDNLSTLLANGYNFYDKDKSTVVNGEYKILANVTVKDGHTHSFDPNTGACSECGKQMAASVTVGEGQSAYYATREEAVSALNAADGAKTLKLFQSRKGNNYKVEGHTLTNGPVTLDLNGQWLDSVTFIAQGITLTLKSEKAGGHVGVVRAAGKDGKIVADSACIQNDDNVKVDTISAQECGQLELSAGTFYDLYVVNDGSSASLSGGIYQPLSYGYGKGPDTSTAYVGTYDLLAKEYGYKKKQNDGSFAWVTDAYITETSRPTYKVAKIGASFEKIYPDEETNFTGDTYLIKLGEDQMTYTLKLTAVSNPASQVSYQWQSGRNDGGWINRPQNSDTDYEVNSDNGTITIKNLNPGTYRYRVQYTLKDSDGKDALAGFSDPLTVVVTKHEHSWAYTAKGATITAKCTVDDCYLTDRNGGSVTINAPAADTLIYDGQKKQATLTWTNWVADVTKDNVEKSINYTGTSNNDKEYKGNIAPADAGTYTASLTMNNSDGSAVKASSAEYTIARATLTVEGTATATAVYKQELRVHEITNISGLTVKCGSKTVNGKWKFDNSYDNLEVGNTKAYPATFTPKADKHNYEPLTKDIVPTITKGTYTNTIATTKNVFTGVAQTGVEVSEMPNIKGAAIVAVSKYSDPDNIIDNVRHENGKVLFDVNNVPEAGKTAIITVTYSSDNYEDFTGTITVKTVNREPANVSISKSISTVTYGDTITLTAKQDGNTSTGGAWRWEYPTDTFDVDGAVNEASITLKPLKATDSAAIVTAKYESATHIGEGTASVTVNKKPIIVEAGTYKVSKTYDGTMDAGNPSGTLSVKGILSADSGVKVEATPVAYTDANVGVQTSMDVLIALEGTGKDNYKINGDATTITVPCEITKATLTAEGAGIASGTYGDKLSKLIISGLTAKLNDKVVNGTWRLTGDTVPNVGDTGTYIATFTPATGAGNYEALTKDVKLNIAKATYGDKNATGSANFGASGVVDLSSMLVEGGNFGTLTVTDTENVLNGIPTIIDGSSLKFTFANEQSKVNKTATVTIPVTSTNYDDYDIIVTVTVKEAPSGGGGGAVIPTTEVVTKDKTTTSPGDVKTETKTGTDGNKETISKVTVSDANQKEIIKQVKDNKSEEIIINVSEKDIADGAKLEINLDKEFIDSIVNDTDAKLTIKTPAGDMTFTKEQLKELSEASTGDTITIDPTDDDSDKAEKIARAKELITELNLTARSGKTAKGNVNVVLKNSTMTKDSIKELEELGFTVKYRFYRSTKKSSGYKSMVTKNTASYTNTTGKKGTKYYYKVRVMVYDADGNLVAKTDLKQCKYAARTWSK